MNSFVAYASIVIDTAIDKTLDYGVTAEQRELVHPGARVKVSVQNRVQTGYVIEVKESSECRSVKPIITLLCDSTSIPSDLFQLALWISRHYAAPLSHTFSLLLPPGVRKGMLPKKQLFVMRRKTREELREFCSAMRTKKPAQAAMLDAILPVKKGILLTELLEVTKGSRSTVHALVKQGFLMLDTLQLDRSPLTGEDYFPTKPKMLNQEQMEALNKIEGSLDRQHFEAHLLYGITGSGKTEIYLRAIQQTLNANKSAIMLVPEIALTTQTMERFRSRFEEKIAILHHRLSEGEKRDSWHNIRSGKVKIILGARSAIFSPAMNLGLIIVDEEHEHSYKQQDRSPCYQARDVAVMRGKLTQSTVILGSATPSLESYYNAQRHKYTLSVLSQRADHASLPKTTVVDMRREFEKAKGFTNFSEVLLNGIEKRQQQGEQTILFLNRRGYHTILICPDCHHSMKCTHCDVALTFHRGEDCLSCHLCHYSIMPPPSTCPTCGGKRPLKFKGVGTEQIERSLHAIFPSIRTLRIDADTTRHRGSHHQLLRAFGTGKADVLIGTQMIAKGLHFPEVTLVGVLNSDSGLNVPDFRASETVFQLITQVSGRAGRGLLAGEVIIQTTIPENATIQYAARQDYLGFYQEEIAIRELFRYPPFTHMAKLLFSGIQAVETEMAAEKWRQLLIQNLPQTFEVHPVTPCGHARVKDRYRYQFLIRGPSITPLNKALTTLNKHHLPRQVKCLIDVNPSSTFF